MAQAQNTEAEIRRYLLGELSREERDVIERRILLDDEFHQQLLMVEEDVIDEYARNEFGDYERERFEKHFMFSLEQRDRVAFATSLQSLFAKRKKGIGPTSTAKTPVWNAWVGPPKSIAWQRLTSPLLICTTILFMILATWCLFQISRLRTEIGALRAVQPKSDQTEQELRQRLLEEESARKALSEQLALNEARLAQMEEEMRRANQRPPSQKATAGTIASVLLAPGLSRGSDRVASVVLSDTAQRLLIKLETDQSRYRKYRVEVKTAEGELVVSEGGLSARQSTGHQLVVFSLPRKLVTKTDYVVFLSGGDSHNNYEAIGTYFFKVLKRQF